MNGYIDDEIDQEFVEEIREKNKFMDYCGLNTGVSKITITKKEVNSGFKAFVGVNTFNSSLKHKNNKTNWDYEGPKDVERIIMSKMTRN